MMQDNTVRGRLIKLRKFLTTYIKLNKSKGPNFIQNNWLKSDYAIFTAIINTPAYNIPIAQIEWITINIIFCFENNKQIDIANCLLNYCINNITSKDSHMEILQILYIKIKRNITIYERVLNHLLETKSKWEPNQ